MPYQGKSIPLLKSCQDIPTVTYPNSPSPAKIWSALQLRGPLAASLWLTSLFMREIVYCVHISLIFLGIENTQTTFPAAFCDALCFGLMLQAVVIYEFEHVIEFGGKWRDGGRRRWGVWEGGPSHWWMKFKFRHLPAHTRILVVSSETISEYVKHIKHLLVFDLCTVLQDCTLILYTFTQNLLYAFMANSFEQNLLWKIKIVLPFF